MKQTSLENQLHISTESSKEGFNDIDFQYFVDELKHCNLDKRMNLQLVPAVLCLYAVYIWLLSYLLLNDPFSYGVLLYFFSS